MIKPGNSLVNQPDVEYTCAICNGGDVKPYDWKDKEGYCHTCGTSRPLNSRVVINDGPHTLTHICWVCGKTICIDKPISPRASGFYVNGVTKHYRDSRCSEECGLST